jgi:predicted nuclease with RNAse H fold
MTPQAPRTTAKVAPPTGKRERGDSAARLGLTRAEAHALRRSAPLTPAQFKELRRLAEHGVNPLRRI